MIGPSERSATSEEARVCVLAPIGKTSSCEYE
jgi:hypothetical protein